jgi:hypothetical protein
MKKGNLRLVKNTEPDRVMAVDSNGVFHLFPNTEKGRADALKVETTKLPARKESWFEKALSNIDAGKKPFED